MTENCCCTSSAWSSCNLRLHNWQQILPTILPSDKNIHLILARGLLCLGCRACTCGCSRRCDIRIVACSVLLPRLLGNISLDVWRRHSVVLRLRKGAVVTTAVSPRGGSRSGRTTLVHVVFRSCGDVLYSGCLLRARHDLRMLFGDRLHVPLAPVLLHRYSLALPSVLGMSGIGGVVRRMALCYLIWHFHVRLWGGCIRTVIAGSFPCCCLHCPQRLAMALHL